MNAVDAAYAHDKRQLGLSGHIEVFGLTRDSSQTDQVLFGLFVFAHVLLGSFEDLDAVLLLFLFVEDEGSGAGRARFSILLALFEQGLWYLGQLTWRLCFSGFWRNKTMRESLNLLETNCVKLGSSKGEC
jgi:hypothetical protein